MKKVAIGFIVLILILLAISFGLRFFVNSKIDEKIAELNKNGFYVNIEKSNSFLTTKAKGKIEVIYPIKALEYLMSKKDKDDLKEQLENILKIIPNSELDDILDGLAFDYDFTLCNISSKLDLNLYLVSLSNRYKYRNFNDSSSLDIQNMLKNRDLKINIDEKGNFKVSDITFISNIGIMTFRGLNGDSKRLNIPFMKLEVIGFDLGYLDNKILVENANLFYNEDKNRKIESKLDIENFDYSGLNESFKVKNLKISSFSNLVDKELKGSSKITFEEFKNKKYDYLYSSVDKDKNQKDFINLKNSSLVLEYDKFPYEKYKEFVNSFSLGLSEKDKDFFEALSKSNMILKIFGESEDLKFYGQNWYKKLKYNSNLELSKDLSSMKFDTLNDIISVLTVDIEVDSESFDNALKNSPDTIKKEITFLDSPNKDFKLIKMELKDDGIYTGGVLSFSKERLTFSKSYYNQDPYSPNIYPIDASMDKLSYTYELINKDLLRVNFKYKTSLGSLSSGGIAVSFPQLTDDSLIKEKSSKTFDKLSVYKSGDTIFSGLLNKDLKASYLMIEGFDENWTDTSVEKEFSVDIDVSKMNDFLEINLRGYSTASNKTDYELLPTATQSYTNDQQSYPSIIADIDLYALKNKK